MEDTTATISSVDMCSLSTRCRYKTGRCPNPRAVKANGTLLLLCEYHRNQQNRTKKRSDMKCRHDRAKKRQAQREKLQKKRHVSSNTICWSPVTSPLASIIAPSTDHDKVQESTSPTAVDIDVSTVNWAPTGVSPSMEDESLAPDDIWLLEYFIL